MIPNIDDPTVGFPPAVILPFPNQEKYVPQYHFSLPGSAVGDPNGVIRYQGKYQFFAWDHASSDDLVSWDLLGWPMRDQPEDADYWTGSVVVDKHNTSGFGTPGNAPMVAIYTIHNKTTDKESIGISSSLNGHDFYAFSGNPVIETDDQVFRDPDVFWHEETNRWIMTVTRSEAKRIVFYSSPDLKSWQWLSEFGGEGLGSKSQWWEVPGLIQVPIKGYGNHRKWLLYCGAGTNKVQYWVGYFDGTTFSLDEGTRSHLTNGTGLEGDVFADFEGVRYSDMGWEVTGNAFSEETGWRGQADQQVDGFLGNRVASSYVNGDYHTNSTLTSPVFKVTKKCINFLIAGGNRPGAECINLIIDGQVRRSTTGDDSNILKWAGWDVAEFIGRDARIQLVDNFDGYWSRIYIDQITFSDILLNHGREHANWVDWGSDFFAPKSVRDYDGVETDVQWLGWIGSWEYEKFRPIPETWGKGAETIFRNLEIKTSPKGYQLIQQPIPALQALRGAVVNVTPRRVNGNTALTDFQPLTNTYELEAEFKLTGAGEKFGLNLCVSDAPQRVVVGYNTVTSNLYLDRSSSGYVTFGPGFATTITAPYKPKGDTLKLRIFVDQASIEVFTEDGERVLTSQIYPDPSGTRLEIFSYGGETNLKSLKAWPLASIWSPK